VVAIAELAAASLLRGYSFFYLYLMKSLKLSFSYLLAVLLLLGHFTQAQTTITTDKPKGMSKTLKGGIIGGLSGAAGGAILGRVIGGKSGTAKGAILGAAVGGAGGALIGRRMDKQALELRRDLEGATVERVGEGIKITFASGILFGSNSSTLTSAAAGNIDELATTLQKYADTNITIDGHTDASGSDAINKPLSQRRAQAVANELTTKGVDTSRITATGYGSTQPVGDNATAAGKAANRRVEVAIFADAKMQKAAKRGQL
jgi:outer membrane protein OmpA-like peptidoglycan-associated protein